MKSDLIHHVCSWRKLGDWILHKVHVLNLQPAYHLKYRKKKKNIFFLFYLCWQVSFHIDFVGNNQALKLYK